MNYRIIKSILCNLHKHADLMTEGIQRDILNEVKKNEFGANFKAIVLKQL